MSTTTLTKQDFVSSQMVRWCPGCGDYVALSAMQRALAELGVTQEEMIFISGIGCSSRFPYYMETYGFHTIHGRALNFATGAKIANPNNQIWVVMGDGDAFSIGGNHLIHFLRRNFNINVLILNNKIYGLTKGQYSPTSEKGKITKSSPKGSLETPLNPAHLVLSSKVSFYARGVDKDILGMKELFKQAQQHQGTSLVEIYQNCNIFNDKAFEKYTNRESKKNTTVLLKEGEPLIFGENQDQGIVFENLELKTIKINNTNDEKRVLIHNPSQGEILPLLYASMSEREDLPTPMGIFKKQTRKIFEEELLARKTEDLNQQSMQNLLNGANTWEI